MPRPNDIDETASRADDKKSEAERDSGDRRDAGAPAGGNRRGPGRQESDRQRGD